MNIIYIHQYFITPEQPGGTRSYWISREMIRRGHRVIVITSSNNQKQFIKKKKIDEIDVIYIRNPYDNKMGIIRRLISFIKFMLSATVIALKYKDIDLVYATSTPLTVGIPALILNWFKKTPYIFEVRDLWPEFPIQIGAIKSRFVKGLLIWLEKLIYRRALHIIALSPGMKDGVICRGISEQKVSMVPNMAKIDKFYSREVNLEIADRFTLNNNKFKAIHFGAMGVANGLDYIIDAAKLSLKQYPEMFEFILLGKGMKEEHLKGRVKDERINNVKFIDNQPMNIVSEIVNCCQVSIVTFLDLPILYTNSPNKLFDSLSAAKPLIVNSDGWTRKLVEENECGYFVSPDKPEELNKVLYKLMDNKNLYMKMAASSRELAEKKYDKDVLVNQVLNIIENVFKNS